MSSASVKTCCLKLYYVFRYSIVHQLTTFKLNDWYQLKDKKQIVKLSVRNVGLICAKS